MKSRDYLLVLIAPALLVLGACGKGTAPGQSAATGAVAATVDGKAISKSEFDEHVANLARQSGHDVPEERKGELLEQLIDMKLAAAAGDKNGLTRDQKVMDQIELARLNVVANAAFEKYLEDHPVTEAELRPEYDAQVAKLPREYRARHILVDDKAVADAIIKDLKGGADFAKVAGQKSTDSSSKNGGDLGWFTLSTMVKPFADAVAALQPGQLTEAPVQSQYGWHVIKLEESRASAVPPFEEVKDRVELFVKGKRIEAYRDELRKSAKIEKKI